MAEAVGPERELLAASSRQRRWLRVAGCLFMLHASVVGTILSDYSEAALLHEDARVVLQRLLEDDRVCGAGQCADQAVEGLSAQALLSQIHEDWDEVEGATFRAVVVAAISWLLMSCLLYGTGGVYGTGGAARSLQRPRHGTLAPAVSAGRRE